MKKEDKRVVVELTEHDATRLLALINREMRQSEKIWQPYWEHLAHEIRQGMERMGSLNNCSNWSET